MADYSSEEEGEMSDTRSSHRHKYRRSVSPEDRSTRRRSPSPPRGGHPRERGRSRGRRSPSPPRGGHSRERERSREHKGSRSRHRQQSCSQDSPSEGELHDAEKSVSEGESPGDSELQGEEEADREEKGEGAEDEAVVVNFCLKHKGALVPDKCPACKACVMAEESSEVRGPVVPSARARFTRSDEKAPVLVLRESTVDLMCHIFTSGRYQVSNHFEELTKEYYYMASSVNERLNANLVLEPFFHKLERSASGRDKGVFLYKNQATKNIREMRIATRNIFMAVEQIDDVYVEMREIGAELGFTYPEVPPESNLVGPRVHKDYLATNGPLSFKPPRLIDILADCEDIDQGVKDKIAKNVQLNDILLKKTFDSLGEKVTSLYDITSKRLNKMEALMTAFLDMYGHCDASQRELVADKLVSLLRPSIRDTVRGRDLTRYPLISLFTFLSTTHL